MLFTPGDRPDMMEKALEGDSDVVVFDLEDAVAPEQKDDAVEAVSEVLEEVDDVSGEGDHPEVWVRVDPRLDGSYGVGEPSCFVLPKADTAGDVRGAVGEVVSNGLSSDVVPIVETAKGVLNAGDIAAEDGVGAVVFGAEDLAADVGATRTREGDEVSYARQKVVTAAAAADVDAVDTLWTEFEDLEGLREDAARSVALGYDGKLAIHPKQVEVINEAFTPEADEVEWAEKVLEARDAAADDGKGVFEVGGEMVDAPLVKQAERVMERARAADMR